jgi:glyceraldehyde-3-phosphate dehydrogenase/erythrose-4-phosphate dehydrogenase
MTVSIEINGFGRIGRGVLRALIESDADDIKVVAINDLAAPETIAHLLRYDSVHGRLKARVRVIGDRIEVGHHSIRLHGQGVDGLDHRSKDCVDRCDLVSIDCDSELAYPGWVE